MQYKSFKTQRRNTVLKLWFLWRKDPTKKHQLIYIFENYISILMGFWGFHL